MAAFLKGNYIGKGRKYFVVIQYILTLKTWKNYLSQDFGWIEMIKSGISNN